MVKRIGICIFLIVPLFISPYGAKKALAGGGPGVQRVLSIPAAAFHPGVSDQVYENYGSYLRHLSRPSGCTGCVTYYYAPVHLPHGTVITSMTAYMQDNYPGKNGTLQLVEAELSTGMVSNWIATANSGPPESLQYQPYYVGGLSAAVLNNTHAYYLQFTVPEMQDSIIYIKLGGVKITYTDWGPGLTEYYSLSGADFTPFSDNYFYTTDGIALNAGGTSEYDHQAAVVLPDAATVTRMTLYYEGVAGKTLSATLCRSFMDSSYSWMANLTADPLAGLGLKTTTGISLAKVDNWAHFYWLYYRLQDGPTPFGVVIEYTRPPIGEGRGMTAVPAAAFIPQIPSYDRENHGRYIRQFPNVGGGVIGIYMAPVSLPQGVSVTRFHQFFGDFNPVQDGIGRIMSSHFDGVASEVAYVDSSGALDWTAKGTSNVHGNPFDFQNHTYWIEMRLPSAAPASTEYIWGLGTVFENYFRGYLPLLMKN